MGEIYKNLSLENIEGEVWRDIQGYEGKYQVSSLGRVKSLKDNNGNYREKIMKQKDNEKYLFICLSLNNKTKYYLVHRLVAFAFLDNPSNLPCVNHKDEKPSNNMASNLEWCTHKYNSNYGTCKTKIADSLSKQVYQYSKDGELVAIWQSVNECGRNGFNFKSISQCCLGKRKTHKGYIWSYNKL